MAIRGLKAVLAVMITCVALVGCGPNAPPQPAPSNEPVVGGGEPRPESALEEQGADAALPPEDRPQEN